MKIACIGSAPSSVALGPYQDANYNQFLGGKPPPQYPPSQFIDETWEIWACSPGAFAFVPRADRWFEVHRWEPGKPWLSPEYVQFLREFRGYVYTGGVVEELAHGVVYPIARVEAEFSSYFLTSSLALMLALAILEIEDLRLERAKRTEMLSRPQPQPMNSAGLPPLDETEDTIGLWGVDMSAMEEWAHQRPGCQFFILEALRRGIGVHVPRESCLLRPMPVYGISEWDHNYIKATARMRELNSKREEHQKTIAKASADAQHLAGAVDNMNYFINTWMSPYGIPAGVTARIIPGTGLGGGMTLNPPPAVEQPPYLTPTETQEVDVGASPHVQTATALADAARELHADVLKRKRTATYSTPRDLVSVEFARQLAAGEITLATLAKRIHRTPKTVDAWLRNGPPTLDALSDLCLGMGFEPALGVREQPRKKAKTRRK